MTSGSNLMIRLPMVIVFSFVLAACQRTAESEPVTQEEPSPPPAEVTPALEIAAPVEQQIDPASGLIIDTGWELVRGHCAACHSIKLVTQNRGSLETWESMIRWMQETQGLWQFDPATETAILNYLAKNYAPAASYRRAPLPPELRPQNSNAPP